MDAFSKDLHALVERHIVESGLTPERAAATMLYAADAALDHLQWKPAEIRSAQATIQAARRNRPCNVLAEQNQR